MDGAAYFRELYLTHCAACVQAGIAPPTPDAWVDTLDAYISENAQDALQDDAGEST